MLTGSRVALATALALVACGKSDRVTASAPADGPEPTVPSQPTMTGDADPAKRPHVLIEAGAQTLRVDVEVVRTPAKIQKGLMYRTFLPQSAGMLFIFDHQKINSFWMKNTLIALDMIFIDKDMNIAGIVENAEPKTTLSRRVDKPSQFVLEVNGGWSAQNGVGPGAKVKFVNVGTIP